MKIDISRDTFSPELAYARILMQQGRVQIDADWNEQVDIFSHHLYCLAHDLLGPAWGSGEGFAVTVDGSQTAFRFHVTAGRYFVHGRLVESTGASDRDVTATLEPGRNYLVALQVAERIETALENSGLADVAFAGADTAARAMLKWTLVIEPQYDQVTPQTAKYYQVDYDRFAALVSPYGVQSGQAQGSLTAQARTPSADSPCSTQVAGKFSGPENQLFRVEICVAGKVGAAKFVWATDNGSVQARWLSTSSGNQITIQGIGTNAVSGFEQGQWVELIDDDSAAKDAPGELQQIANVNGNVLTLSHAPQAQPGSKSRVRRWNSGARDVSSDLTSLDNGIQVQFASTGPGGEDCYYQVGDYWQIPARVATSDIDWPGAVGHRLPVPARRPFRYRVPLAFVQMPARIAPPVVTDLRPVPLSLLLSASRTMFADRTHFVRHEGRKLYPLLTAIGSGKQIYTPQPDENGKLGRLPSPEDVVLNSTRGQVIGRLHGSYAAPVWEMADGSRAEGVPVKPFTPAPDLAPQMWKLKKAKTGIFANVSYVRQLHAVGGGAPPSSSSDSEVSPAYMATYLFF